MDSNITARPYPLPYPAEPCAKSWYAEHPAPTLPQPQTSQQATESAE